MSDLAIILDLDNTVFQTRQFNDDLGPVLEAGFGVDSRRFRASVPDFYVAGKEGLRHYDFFGHVSQLGLDANEVEAYILECFAGRDYAYGDVPPFMDFLTKQVGSDLLILLTYGESRFQQMKFKCVPSLGKLKYADTLQPKGDYIRENFSGRRGLIIDDKIVNGLQGGFRQIWLTRNRVSLARESYSSLGAIQEQWDEIIAA